MTAYNTLLERVVLPAGDAVLRTSFIRQLRDWRQVQWLDRDTMERLQSSRLAALLTNATRRVPYYRDLAIPEGQDVYAWLRRFPVLTKAAIKSNLERLVLGDRAKLIGESSSGSSGVQGRVYSTRHEVSTTRAIQVLWWEWAGYRLGDPVLQTGITPERSPLKATKDMLLRTDYRSAYSLDDTALTKAVESLGRRPGSMLLGYASSLYLIAKAARAMGRTDLRVRGIVSWGDKLFEHYRRSLEDAFGTSVHDTYACTEGCMIAGQCSRQRYHITSPQVHLELLDAKLEHEVPSGELGHVVVTRLDAHAMPLIRYYLGDLAVREETDAACECGRNLPLLRQVIGRNTDIVRTRSGKYLVVHFFTGIFEHVPEIRQFRVLQRQLDGIEIEYIPDHGFHLEVLRELERRIHERLGEPLAVQFRAVADIPATASGKPQIVHTSVGVPGSCI